MTNAFFWSGSSITCIITQLFISRILNVKGIIHVHILCIYVFTLQIDGLKDLGGIEMFALWFNPSDGRLYQQGSERGMAFVNAKNIPALFLTALSEYFILLCTCL